MKLEDTELFKEFSCYLVTNSENRKMVILKSKILKINTLMSYARYLLCLKENRILNETEQADHIDEDKTNDDINNLQILSKQENIRKHYLSLKGKRFLLLKCPACDTIFEREYRNCFSRKKSKFHCCSKECLHTALSKYSLDELKIFGENQIIKEFYRNDLKKLN